MSKFKIGDRVRTVRCHQHDSTNCEQHAEFIGIIDTVVDVSVFSSYPYELANTGLNHWRDEELELVTEGGDQPMARRTFKQLKDSVTVKKNALWQEACDDGTQEYILLDESFNKDLRNTQRIYDRSLVEDDQKNFVEVFQVTPQYMTQDELDQWEKFKLKTKGRQIFVKVESAKTPVDRKATWTRARRRAMSRKMKAHWAAKKAA